MLELFDGHAPTPQPSRSPPIPTDPRRRVSRPKITYLRDLAQHVEDGTLELDRLDELSDEKIIEELTAVKGIGEWSAHMFLMFHRAAPTCSPVGDQGIRNASKTQYRLRSAPTRSGSRRSPSPGARHGRWPASDLWSSLDNTPA